MTWSETYAQSGYMVAPLAKFAAIDEGSFRKYLNGTRTPRKQNLAKMEKAMIEAAKNARLQPHPSYGYATEEQITRLKSMGIGPDMDLLLKQISRQTEFKGKYIFAQGEVE